MASLYTLKYRIKGAPFIRGQPKKLPCTLLFLGSLVFFKFNFFTKKSTHLAKNKVYMKLLAVKNTFTECSMTLH